MPAVLHVSGKKLDLEAVLPSLSLKPYRIYRKGEPIPHCKPKAKKTHPSSGFCCDISFAQGRLSKQAKDAMLFLSRHHTALASLRDHDAVDDMRIDFGYCCRSGKRYAALYEFLPPELLRLAGELGIGFEFSFYFTSDAKDC